MIQWMGSVYVLLDILEKNVTKNALQDSMELDVPQSVIVKMGQNAIFDMDFVIVQKVGEVQVVLYPVGDKQRI